MGGLFVGFLFVCFGAGCTLSRCGTCISIEPASLWVLEKSSYILFPQWQFWDDTALSTLSCNGWILQVKSWLFHLAFENVFCFILFRLQICNTFFLLFWAFPGPGSYSVLGTHAAWLVVVSSSPWSQEMLKDESWSVFIWACVCLCMCSYLLYSRSGVVVVEAVSYKWFFSFQCYVLHPVCI